MTADEPVVVGKIVPGVGERKAVDSLTVRVDGSRVITLAPFDPCAPRHVAFDGRRFVVGHGMWGSAAEDLYHMTRLDLAYRARRGDESAVAVLTAFGVTIDDADGQPYWPAG